MKENYPLKHMGFISFGMPNSGKQRKNDMLKRQGEDKKLN